MDKGSGVFRQHTAVSKTRVSKQRRLLRKHHENKPSENHSSVSNKQIKTQGLEYFFTGSLCSAVGDMEPFWTLVVCFQVTERWLVGLACLPLFGVNTWKKPMEETRAEKHIYIQIGGDVVHQRLAHK